MKPKILVVDDEWSMQELLRQTLSLAGFEVLIAANHLEFKEQAFLHSPDVMIVDIMLGEKDGAQIYHQLLAEGLSPDIPVVFLSALASGITPTPPQPGRKFALIGKPFDPNQLVRELEKVVKT